MGGTPQKKMKRLILEGDMRYNVFMETIRVFRDQMRWAKVIRGESNLGSRYEAGGFSFNLSVATCGDTFVGNSSEYITSCVSFYVHGIIVSYSFPQTFRNIHAFQC